MVDMEALYFAGFMTVLLAIMEKLSHKYITLRLQYYILLSITANYFRAIVWINTVFLILAISAKTADISNVTSFLNAKKGRN